jgi:hypothetical protein
LLKREHIKSSPKVSQCCLIPFHFKENPIRFQ